MRPRTLQKGPLYDVSVLVLAAFVAWAALHAAAQRSDRLRAIPRSNRVASEISYKADLLERRRHRPQLIFYGGSRSERFDPAYARRRTGLRAFNFATSSARPEGAWALANWLLARSPGVRLRWVWGLQWSQFFDRDLNAGLVQDERFSWYFPDRLVRSQLAAVQRGTQSGHAGESFLRSRYAADGLLLRNTYDVRRERGRTLAESLQHYISRARRKLSGTGRVSEHGKSRAQRYFERTLGLLNRRGCTPVIVLMPTQPKVAAALRNSGGGNGHQHLLAYLRTLADRYSFRTVDLSTVASFKGDPAGFYDGVHVTRANADRMIDAIVKKAGDVLR
jgi:hypothetical protein